MLSRAKYHLRHCLEYLPKAELEAGDPGCGIVEIVITDGAPRSVVFDL